MGQAIAVTAAAASEFPQPPVTGDWTIKAALEEIGLQIEITGEATPSEWDPAPACVTLSSLDQQVGCSKKGGSDPAAWYAHGLAVPWRTQWISNGNISCPAFDGLLWRAGGYCDPEPVTEQDVREDFVVFEIPTTAGPPAAAARLTHGIHELSHVLNLHHCDHGVELLDQGRLGDKGREHVCEARTESTSAAESYRHVRPGSDGLPWCHLTTPHVQMHGARTCCPDDPRGKWIEPAAELKIDPDRKEYCPGEPITVTIRLSAIQDFDYRSEHSLDPPYGYVTVWQKSASGDFRPLRSPVYADGPLDFVTLPKGDSAVLRHIPIWYGTGLDSSDTFEIKAGYAGFRTPEATVVSQPATVSIVDDPEPGGRCDDASRRAFGHPEARRFVWLLGGDHLRGGRARLEEISNGDSASVYAAWTNLALLVHWGQPFHYLTAEGRLAVRDPDPKRVRLYDSRLRPLIPLLPGGYGTMPDPILLDLGLSRPAPAIP